MGRGGTEKRGRGWMRCRLCGRDGERIWYIRLWPLMPWGKNSGGPVLFIYPVGKQFISSNHHSPNPLLGYRPLPMVPWNWYRVKLGSLISLLILIGLVFCLQEGTGHVVRVQSTEQ